MDCLGRFLGSYCRKLPVIDGALGDLSLLNVKDPEMKGRIIDARSNMQNLNFLFGSRLGKIILKQTDNFSKTLQNPDLSAAESQEIADVVITLEKDRNEKNIQQHNILTKHLKISIDDFTLSLRYLILQFKVLEHDSTKKISNNIPCFNNSF